MNWGAIVAAAKTAVNAAQWWGRFSKWRKERTAQDVTKVGILFVAIYLSMGASCGPLFRDLREYCRQHPEECGGTPRPTPEPTSTATSTPTSAPTSIPATPTPSPSPSPSPVATATPTPRPISNVAPPVLVLWKVQGFNSGSNYNCHNPKDGPLFQQGHICLKDSTMIFCDPNDSSKCGPCDQDHQDNWKTFCHERDWDDPRGPSRNVDGADEWQVSEDNPFQTIIRFVPGESFMICVRPRKDVHTADDIPIPVKGPAESCKSETY